MPYPWKTTARKIPAEDHVPEEESLPYQPSGNDLILHVLKSIMRVPPTRQNVSGLLLVERDGSHSAIDDAAVEANDGLRALQAAVEENSPESINNALQRIKDHAQHILDTNSDMSDPVVSSAYRVLGRVNFVQSLIKANTAAEEKGRTRMKQFSSRLPAVDLSVSDQFTNGIIPLSKPNKEQQALITSCKEDIERFNSNVGRQQDLLDRQYEKYLTLKGAADDPELQEQFEADYYRKFHNYMEDRAAYNGFLDTLVNMAHSASSQPGDPFDNLAKKLKGTVPQEKNMDVDRQAMLVALVENAGKEPLDKKAIENRVNELKNDKNLSSLYKNYIVTPVMEARQRIIDQENEYEFSTWRALGLSQENLGFSLSDKFSLLENSINVRAMNTVPQVVSYASDLSRRRPFYEAARTQLTAMREELLGMSTKSMGRGNSDQFAAMLQTVSELGDSNNLPDPMSPEDKTNFERRLNLISRQAKEYMDAKKVQKGIDINTLPVREPTFHTTQGRKRYEYAKKLKSLAAQMSQSLNEANLLVDASVKPMKDAAKAAGNRNEAIKGKQINTKNMKNSLTMNLPGHIDHFTKEYDQVKNMTEQGILKDKMNVINQEIQLSQGDPEKVSEKMVEKVHVMMDLARTETMGPSEKEMNTIEAKLKDGDSKNPMKTILGNVNRSLYHTEFKMFRISAQEDKAHRENIVKMKDDVEQRKAKLKNPQEQKDMVEHKEHSKNKAVGMGS